jgi:hypothetical protein
MIPSATELGAFSLLYAAPSFPQVTMGCDPGPIFMLSAFRGSEELILRCFKVAMGEKARSLIAHHVSPRDLDGRLITSAILWARVRDSRHLASRGWKELAFLFSKSREARRRGA